MPPHTFTCDNLFRKKFWVFLTLHNCICRIRIKITCFNIKEKSFWRTATDRYLFYASNRSNDLIGFWPCTLGKINNAFFINFKRLSVFNSQTHVITELVKKKIVKYLHKCNELFTISTILFNVSFVDIS